MLASLSRLIDDAHEIRRYAEFLRAATSLGRPSRRLPRRQSTARRLLTGLAERYAPPGPTLDALQGAAADVSSSALSRLNYSSLIVALYGAIERFGEASVGEYVEYLNRVLPTYATVPPALRQAHIEAAVKLLQAPDLDRYATANEVVANLNSCLSHASAFRLNPATFAYHSTNFRSSLFREIWARVGVAAVTDAIKSDPNYKAAVEALDPAMGPSFYHFDDVAERRNEVAHGSPPADILSTDIFLGYVDIVEAFCRSLTLRVSDAALANLAVHHGADRGGPIAVFNSEVVCLRCTSQPIAVGDLLIARLPNGDHRAGVISSLQVGNQAEKVIEPAGDSVDVGVKIDFHAKDNQVFWTVEQADPVGSLWRGRFP